MILQSAPGRGFKLKKIVVTKRSGIYVFPLDEIFYMEKNLRKIKLYTRGSSVEFYGTFADMIPSLDRRFMSCHRSYLINMDKIVIMSGNTIFFENNDRIHLGRDTYGRARRIFCEYLAKKGQMKK